MAQRSPSAAPETFVPVSFQPVKAHAVNLPPSEGWFKIGQYQSR